jgi:hypothetical protein
VWCRHKFSVPLASTRKRRTILEIRKLDRRSSGGLGPKSSQERV